MFSADRAGKINWEAWIKPPYVGMIHDFAVTQKHIAFFISPLATNMDADPGGTRYISPGIRACRATWA